jgi:ATP-dependent protease ClpP protease subunit
VVEEGLFWFIQRKSKEEVVMYDESNTELLVEKSLTVAVVSRTLVDLQKRAVNNLFISSPGGDANVILFGIKHLMPKRITVIGGGEVGSAALALFLCGHKRVALPDAQFCFHEAYTWMNGKVVRESEVQMLAEIAHIDGRLENAKDLSQTLNMFRDVNANTVRLLSNATTMATERIYNLIRGEGVRMSAEEALYYRLAHEIIPLSNIDF